MAVVFGKEIGMKVLEALGITDARVRSVDIRIRFKEQVLVTVERLCEQQDAEGLVTELRKYRIVDASEMGDCDANRA